MSQIPTFLKPLDTVLTSWSDTPFSNAIFLHQPPLAPVHALWWPCTAAGNAPEVVVFFIPGKLLPDHCVARIVE